jgi:hypothetical protein
VIDKYRHQSVSMAKQCAHEGYVLDYEVLSYDPGGPLYTRSFCVIRDSLSSSVVNREPPDS